MVFTLKFFIIMILVSTWCGYEDKISGLKVKLTFVLYAFLTVKFFICIYILSVLILDVVCICIL